MKHLLILLLGALTFMACESSATEEACVKIYEEGIQEVNAASSHKELSDISLKVNTEIMQIANGPAGEEAMTAKGSQALQNAQHEFFRAIERRGRQLMPQ